MTIRMIVAMDPNGVIGVDGAIPWHYKADFKRFKAVTMGGALVMGRRTWESLPKPLPGRRMIVITRQEKPVSKHPEGSCEYYGSPDVALLAASSDQHGNNGDVWVIGGGEVYREYAKDADEIDLTLVPAVSDEAIQKGTSVTHFDANLLERFEMMSESINEEDARLTHRKYKRIA